jgi:hypothetical protein
VRRIGRELGAQYVVEGSVRKAGDRLRIIAQLIEAVSGNHLWAERYDCDLKDMAGKLTASSLKERYRPASMEAYDLCLRGRAEWVHSSEAGVDAIPLFERPSRSIPTTRKPIAGWQLVRTMLGHI